MEEKQIIRVLNAVQEHGARTSLDAADVTGLSVRQCSAYLSELRACGLLVAKRWVRPDPNGKDYLFYEVAK